MSFCTFKKYDFGTTSGNMEAYGTSTAPDYDFDKITTDTYLYFGEQDNLGPPNVSDLMRDIEKNQNL